MRHRQFLFLNQYYAPDPAPTGQFLHDLARVLVRRGHGVEVIASKRGYGGEGRFEALQELDGVRIRRVSGLGLGRASAPGRVADYASYLLPLLAAGLRGPRPDLVLSLTTPPFVGVAGAVLARMRGARRADWVMDLYPDVMSAHEMVAPRGAVARALRRLTRRQLGRSDLVLVLGPWMARKALAYAPAGRVAEVPLWSEPAGVALTPTEIAEVRRERGWSDRDIVLMYSGNLGLGHLTGEFLEAARRLGPGGPLWAFVGGGPRRPAIRRFAEANPLARVQLQDYVPRERLRASLAAGDVHLVSLASGWQGLIVPSKLQGVFGVARPVLFVGGADNEIAGWVKESGGGWVVPEGDVEGLLTAVREASRREEREQRGRAALAFARAHFDRERNCAQIADLLERAVERMP